MRKRCLLEFALCAGPAVLSRDLREQRPRLLDERDDALRLVAPEACLGLLARLLGPARAGEDLGEREARRRRTRARVTRRPRSSADRASASASSRSPRRAMIRACTTRSSRIRDRRARRAIAQPLLGLVDSSLGLESLRDQVGLGGLVRAISHLLEHGVGGTRLALGRLVVAGQHLDEHGDVGRCGP